jgi:hypothetical protein
MRELETRVLSASIHGNCVKIRSLFTKGQRKGTHVHQAQANCRQIGYRQMSNRRDRFSKSLLHGLDNL